MIQSYESYKSSAEVGIDSRTFISIRQTTRNAYEDLLRLVTTQTIVRLNCSYFVAIRTGYYFLAQGPVVG